MKTITDTIDYMTYRELIKAATNLSFEITKDIVDEKMGMSELKMILLSAYVARALELKKLN